MGIGTDIIEVSRIKKLCRRKSFLKRFFTKDEFESALGKSHFYHHIAGKFAAKEAVAKALGTGFRFFKFRDIQIVNDKMGKPYVRLSGRAQEILTSQGFSQVLVTISHCREYAVAFAVAKEE